MKYFFAFALGVSLFTIAAGCARKSGSVDRLGRGQQMQDGVQVGNGRTKQFVSQKYKFELHYDDSLQLHPHGPDRAVFDSLSSKTEVKVFPGGILNGQDLGTEDKIRSYLLLEYPGLLFRQEKLDGLPWFHFSGIVGPSKVGWHFVLTPLRDLVVAQVTTATDTDDSDTASALFSTFRFDIKPPDVFGLRVDHATTMAGERNSVSVNIVDNVVGVLEHAEGKLNAFGVSKVIPGCTTRSEFSIDLVPSRDGGYTADIPVAARLCPGNYAISQWSVWDKAGNARTIRSASQKKPDPAQNYLGTEARSIGIVRFAVTARPDTGDRKPPVVANLSPSSIQMEAGATKELRFRAFDEGGADGEVDDYRNRWGVFLPTFKTISSVEIPLSGAAQMLSKGEYSLPIRPSPSLPAGEYYLNYFDVADKAAGRPNNVRLTALLANRPKDRTQVWKYEHSNIPVVILNLANPEVSDVDPPRLLSLRLRANKIKAGNLASLEFTATDVGLGIADYFSVGGVFVPLSVKGEEAPFYAMGPIRQKEGRFYLDFFVEEDARPGFYVLGFFKLWDRARNFQDWNAGDPALLPRDPAQLAKLFYRGETAGLHPLVTVEILKN